MSTQAEVNASAYQYVLYYIGVDQKDSGIYPIDLSGICVLDFGPGDTIVCNSWLLGDSYPAPSNDTLLSYVSSTVLTWYANFYTTPAAIGDAQFYKISTSALSAIRADSSMIGFQAFDTTAKAQKIWNGISWASTAPSVSSAWSSASTGVTFTANTPKVVDVSGFTQTDNTGSEWKVDTATGRHTYSGQTRPFSISINYAVTKATVLTTQTLTSYISKNGSTTISGKRLRETFVLAGPSDTNPRCITANMQMSYGDYLQLGANYTSTIGGGGISFSDVSYEISGC